MKALRIHKNQIVRVENIDKPILENDKVLVKVAACGICGSDIPRVLNNKAHYYPIILGHEFSGVIADVGQDVKNVKLGDHVVCAPLIPCGICEDCSNGNYSLCKNYKFVGSSLQGAMAEYVSIPAHNIVKIPYDIDLIDACMVEPMSVTLHALKQNNHIQGKKVAVFGMGTIGSILIQVVKAVGAELVTAFVRNNKYDDMLHNMGVKSIVYTNSDTWIQEALKETQNRGYDFVYETAGSADTIKQCIEVVGNKGKICCVGTPKTSLTISVNLWEKINRKECYITGSWMSYSYPFPGEEWVKAVSYLEQGIVKIYDSMINSKTYIEDAESVFNSYKNNGTVKGRKIIVIDKELVNDITK